MFWLSLSNDTGKSSKADHISSKVSTLSSYFDDVCCGRLHPVSRCVCREWARCFLLQPALQHREWAVPKPRWQWHLRPQHLMKLNLDRSTKLMPLTNLWWNCLEPTESTPTKTVEASSDARSIALGSQRFPPPEPCPLRLTAISATRTAWVFSNFSKAVLCAQSSQLKRMAIDLHGPFSIQFIPSIFLNPHEPVWKPSGSWVMSH